MESSETITSDFLLQELGGCGLFQMIFSTFLYLPHITGAFSTMVMVFGAYNPGWKCMDNSTSRSLDNYNSTSQDSLRIIKHANDMNYDRDEVNIKTANDYLVRSCQEFDVCQHVQFNPDVSTVVTEWGLVCDKAWTVPAIMTVQISGGLVGALLLGYLGDRFGRKFTLYIHLLLHGVMNVILMFSVSWEMFAVVQFFTGICHPVFAYLPLAYLSEYVPQKFRPVVGSIPVWALGNIFFTVSAMTTKNWKTIHIIIVFMDFVWLLTAFWVPESLRWLAVNNKTEAYLKTGKKIANLNRSNMNKEHCLKLIKVEREKANIGKNFGVFDLFRRGYAMYTIIFGFSLLSMNVFYYVAHLGVSYLPGDLFTKMLISTATEVPANVFAVVAPNYLGRKKCCSGAILFQAVCITGAVLVNVFVSKTTDAWAIGLLVFIVVGKSAAPVAWYVFCVQVAELYPTVVRTSASGYSGLMGVFGTLIAPSLIPTGSSSTFTRNYLIVAAMLFVSGILVLLVPETKGKPMKDTFETNHREDLNRSPSKPKDHVQEDDTVPFRL